MLCGIWLGVSLTISLRNYNVILRGHKCYMKNKYPQTQEIRKQVFSLFRL